MRKKARGHSSNWLGNVQFDPAAIQTIETEEQIAEVIQKAIQQKQPIRVMGSGHSFSPLIATSGILMNLEGLTGVIELNPIKKEATVWGGTHLHQLGDQLYQRGFAMENLGDIDLQTIAGAVSTGTHGTGLRFGSISTQVRGLELWNGVGERIEINADKNADLLDAARVSLGALGVLSRVKLKVESRYVLEMKQTKESLPSILSGLSGDLKNERNFEFFWFPHTETALVKRSRRSQHPPLKPGLGQKFNDVVLENYALGALSGLCRWVPAIAPQISAFCAVAAGDNYRRDWSHRVFATERSVKFIEMEYAVPMQKFATVVDEIQSEIRRGKHRVHFPIECRFVQGDSVWLSPAYQRDSALIAIHMYQGMPYQGYFDAIEKIFRKHEGRPHWGKCHSLSVQELRDLYPRWDAFQHLRMEMDPHGLFETEYLKTILGRNRPLVALKKSA